MIHIVPINDAIEHEEHTMCGCNPEVDFSLPEVIVVHNALDGRE